MGAIEKSIQDLRSHTEAKHEELEHARWEDRHQHKQAVGELRCQIANMAGEFTTQLRASIETLQGAQNQQLQQVMSNFDELKALIANRTDREPSKNPRVEPQA